MKKSILIFLLFLSVGLLAQKNHKGLILERTVSNFGKVEYWMSRVDTFWVTNTTNKRIYILKQKTPREFEVKIPRLGIDPGASEPIEVIYKPDKKGAFDVELKLFHSASHKPFAFHFKGEIVDFDPYARMACPSFSTPNFQRHEFDMKIKVIDSITGEPIEKAMIELSKGEDFRQFYTDKKGVMQRRSRIGLFFVFTEAKGYKSKDINHYFNPQRREITIGLVPIEVKENELLDVSSAEEITIDQKKASIDFKSEKEELVKQEIKYIPTELPPEKEENNAFPLSSYSENNIVFLIDVSSSMRGKDRLDLLKTSMIQLTYMLRSVDKVTIVTYSDESQVVLNSVSAKEKEKIIEVINSLKASGSTYGGKAIKKAYRVLEEQFMSYGNNQIILATDGGFNGLGKSENQLKRLVRRKSKKNLFFSTLGFGKNRRGKELIEALSVEGNGDYLYIKDENEAKTQLNEMVMKQSYRKP